MKKKILIVGAGISGEIIGREIINSDKAILIGYLDDDPNKISTTINDKPVIGKISLIQEFINQYEIDQVIISIPSADGRKLKNILQNLIHNDIQIQIVPGFYNILEQDTKIDYPIRDVDVSDLLGRPKVQLDITSIASYLSGKQVLITGAGGSIGRELSKLIAGVNPDKLILLGRGENSIFHVYNELKHLYPDVNTFPSICNITDQIGLEGIFSKYQPQVIFHAAAHKHVQLMENHTKEAFKNNVLGSKNLMELSLKYDVEKFILISSDKAVRPTSMMGLTKRISELLMAHYSEENNTVFCAVRFGNVLGSRGSVLPLFKEQIKRGGPVTVTHKDAMRYFMTIPEASTLVLQSGAMAKGNEIFILNMGEAIRIFDLAKLLIQIYRPNLGKEINIQFIGLRPGEKLEEELWTPNESAGNSQDKDIFLVYPKRLDNYSNLLELVESIARNLEEYSDDEVKAKLFNILSNDLAELVKD